MNKQNLSERDICTKFINPAIQNAGRNTLKHVHDDNYQLIEVERHEEESIADLLSKIELKDDVDEETKKWFNR